MRYELQADCSLESVADYEYGYRQALADLVVRPVVFAAYSGVSRWMDSAGEVLAGQVGSGTKSQELATWRTALDPGGDWIPHVLAAADQRLSDVRAAGTPDAGALLLARDQETARAYAQILADVTGEVPTVVVSDDPTSDKQLQEYSRGKQRWIVAVQMVSEGLDIPRLSVLVWATPNRTRMFFAQAVGRVVRSRQPKEQATVFLPALRPLLTLAADLETQCNHVIPPPEPSDEGFADLTVERSEAGETLTALEASAQFAHILHDGQAILPGASPTSQAAPGAFGSADLSDQEEDFLGLPGLLSPEQTAALLAARDSETAKQTNASVLTDARMSWRDVKEIRRALNRLVAQVAGRTGD